MTLVYYHLPKTGGRGIVAWMIKNLGAAQVLKLRRPHVDRSRHLFETRGVGFDPSPWTVITGHDVFEALGDVHYTGIRDPAERLYSSYRFVMRDSRDRPSWSDWIRGRYRLCWCLWCNYGGSRHTNNPMAWWFASRALPLTEPSDPLPLAREVLRRTRVYDVVDTPDLICDLAQELQIDPMTYEPIDASGDGSRVSRGQREDVEAYHPGDVALYEWAQGEVVSSNTGEGA